MTNCLYFEDLEFNIFDALVPVYHVLCMSSLPCVHWHLCTKIIYSLLIFTHVFFCT